MVVLPHSIGLKTLGFCPYLPHSFPEDRNSDEFHSGSVGLGCFCLEEKQTHTHTHTGIIHLPRHLQDTKSKVLARSDQQLPAAPAVIPPAPCPVGFPAVWSPTKGSPGVFDTICAILPFCTFAPPDTP